MNKNKNKKNSRFTRFQIFYVAAVVLAVFIVLDTPYSAELTAKLVTALLAGTVVILTFDESKSLPWKMAGILALIVPYINTLPDLIPIFTA